MPCIFLEFLFPADVSSLAILVGGVLAANHAAAAGDVSDAPSTEPSHPGIAPSMAGTVKQVAEL